MFKQNPFAAVAAVIDDHPWSFLLGWVAVFTIIRLVLLFFYDSSLGPDEAQYWFWGRDFDWGYYSKPPMIAWVIGLPTALFGDHEWSVRLLSPIFIGAAAVVLFATGRRLFGDVVGLWAGVLWLVLPAVMLGATIISTDVPLLFFWSLALWALVALAEAQSRREAVQYAGLLGTAIGLGLLSKYAMIYFLLGWALAALVSPFARLAWQGGRALIALGVAAVVFAPNLLWNSRNGFQTIGHTADNANWGSDLLNPDELLQFVGDQFGVAGPLLFGALLVAFFWRSRAVADQGRARMLLCFVVPPLLIISGQALLSRAHANWAMTAYPAALIFLPYWLRQRKANWVLWGSAGLHAAIGLMATVVLLDFGVADTLGRSNDVKRLRAWDQTAAQIRAAGEGADAIVADERELIAHLVWEFRDTDVSILAADLDSRKDNTYEYELPFLPEATGRYLIATQYADVPCAYATFSDVTARGESFVDLNAQRHGRPERTILLYEMAGFDPQRSRPSRCDTP